MKIVLASRNAGKIRELRKLMNEYFGDRVEVLSLDDIGFYDDVVEDGTTFEENAMIKAHAVSSLGYIGVADDSGLSAWGLGGAPGVFSARYSGEHGDDEKNNDKLLAELSHKADRSASYVCVIACAFPEDDEREDFLVRGECNGVILEERHGTGGFGYDPLFYFPEFGKTFAELTQNEKDSVSHRGKAMKIFAEKLKKYIDVDGN